jgi:L-lactate dehydrogenase (cytochrome)
MFDPGITVTDLDWLREHWTGRIVVKGVQRADDAAAVVAAGADGLVISNHGGRQLDRAVAPLEVLPAVLEEVAGRVPVLIDGGVLDGADAVAAVARGADAVLVGRAYLYGLMAGGEAGVSRALEILTDQVTRTMRLLGVTSLRELTPDHAAPAPAGGATGPTTDRPTRT